jgi:phenylacetate-CoA ligase
VFNLFDISLKLNGFPLEKAKKELSKIITIPEDEYQTFIDNKKNEIVDYHLKNNNFYKELVGKLKIENWQDLPIMTKKDFQRPLLERLSKGFSNKNIYSNKTSGSSGNPMVFAKDKMYHAMIWANIIRRFDWYGIDFNHSYQARFYGMPIDKIANLKLRAKDFLSHRYRLNIFDLSDTGIEKILHHFKHKKFDYINGYTSTIVLIAKYLKKNNLILKNICPSLKVCIVTSEMLFEEDKILLENQLGIPIVNEYGASEVEVLAFQNTENEWIVNTETTFIEIVDKNGKAVPNGQKGKILVTSLYNFAHPFIRYEVGDYGILDEKSTPKKTILKKLIGRTNDVALLPSGKKAPGMTFYSITKKLFNDDGNVKEFVIHQTKLDTFEIIYNGEKEFSEKEIHKIKAVFSDFLEPNLTFVFKKTSILERNTSGKLKQFVSFVR